jgi:hypothetical protein
LFAVVTATPGGYRRHPEDGRVVVGERQLRPRPQDGVDADGSGVRKAGEEQLQRRFVYLRARRQRRQIEADECGAAGRLYRQAGVSSKVGVRRRRRNERIGGGRHLRPGACGTQKKSNGEQQTARAS